MWIFSTSRVNWQDPFQPWRVWAHYWYGGFIQNSDWGHMMIENIPTRWKALMTMEIGDFTFSCFFFWGGSNFHCFFLFNGFGAGWQFGATTKTVWTFGNRGKENMSSVPCDPFLLSKRQLFRVFAVTPWKINMEPTHPPFRKEHDLPNLHDYVPC